jgi:prophage regulatory protein
MSRHLLGAAEIRERLGGISRQRVYQLTQRSDWPAPYDELVQGKVWRRDDVEGWIEEHRPHLDSRDEV